LYLKKLEILGFKSFADKAVLDLEPGVTVIVGPNGAGKSNIAEAIRWVMGEQSARILRGAKMEDIIFAGSQKRRALSLAEVTLVLDNAMGEVAVDFSEVSVSRRVDRGGESQFLLNRVSCRLKDIQDLFAGTGLGKDAYSVIGQGTIDEILNARPEDRRGIVEEAAGIVRFRNRKKEALRKIEHTERNLERVSDIVEELSSQMEPLREEARRAEEYRRYQKELLDLEMAIAVREALKARSRLSELGEGIDGLARKRSGACQELEEAEERLEVLRQESSALGEDETRAREEFSRASLDMERGAAQLEAVKERAQGLMDERDSLGAQVAALKEEIESAKSVEVKDRKALEAFRTEVEALSGRVFQEQARAGRAAEAVKTCRASLEADKAHLIDILNERSWAAQNAETLRVRLESAQRQVERLQRRRQEVEAAIEGVARQEALQGAEIRDLRRQVDDKEGEAAELRAMAEERSRERQALEAEARSVADRLTSITSRLKALKEMEASFEGFSSGPRSLLRAASRDKSLGGGILGPVARLISVESGKEKAVEAALGAAAENIVVRSQHDARRCIDYLKSTNSGRATFLPLDLITPNPLGQADLEAAQGAGGLGTALSMVKAEAHLKGAPEFLLGRVLVAPSLEAGLCVAKSVGLRYKVVTLEGEVIWPGGSMTGGSRGAGDRSRFLARADEIRDLETGASSCQEGLAQLEKRSKELSGAMGEINSRLEETEAFLKQRQAAMAEAGGRLMAARAEGERLRDDLAALDWEEAQAQEEAGESGQGPQADLDAIALRETEIRQRIAASEGDLRVYEEALAEASRVLGDIRVDEAKHREALQARESALEAKREAQERMERELGQRREERARLESRLSEATQRAATLEGDLARATGARAAAQASLEALRDALREKAEGASSLDRRAKRLRRSLEQLDNDMHALELARARVDVELSNVLGRLEVEYHLSLEEAAQRLDEPGMVDLEPGAVPGRIQELRDLMASMGEVNLGAVEECRRVMARHDFLDSQRKDLVESRKSLEGLIQDIDRSIKDLFLETFRQVQAAFQQVFQELFNGGEANLVLTDENDLLETGVEIKAQPPGRKTQSLSLLSGGERSLTAIALLFALLTVKPSPFVVLDEIEAALDEANVQRFARMLRAFSESTQFIVISHQRGTMECARALYGVTMEESGVSKLISVRLEDKGEAVAG
jgi:chromosome segregation protein